MNKRKKASSSASRSTRGGHLLGPPRAAAGGTKSNGTKGKSPGNRKAAPRKEPASNTLALAAECTVSDAVSLKEHLAGLLDEPQAVTLDITALQRIDTAGIQVITAFVRERAGHGRPVEWQGTAPVLATAARLLGLTSLLKLPA
ncbi:MAG: anti-anti-sigma factor [Gammaproteobacteria bacterium]|jgi:ABC-type transporter Mla MlaB component|nr:anti-anti-sigma factor [Gammaproteobacteria bacterium]